jgi:ERCC4-type nuclease
MAIERKTVSDLRAFRDGRFAEQRSRMVECYGTERCVYIIEGECESTELGVLMSLQFRDRITVIKTVNIEDNACVVEKLSSLAEEGAGLEHRCTRSLRKVKKSPDVTPKSAALSAFLSNIPGISLKMAWCIAEHLMALETYASVSRIPTDQRHT